MKEKYTRVELEEKLKKIKEENAKLPAIELEDFRRVAMCYSSAMPMYKSKYEFDCVKCGQKVNVEEMAYSQGEQTTLELTLEIIEKIKEKGFDVEYELVCGNCHKAEVEYKVRYTLRRDYNIIFRFKTKDENEYRETICNNISYYKMCLDFLDGELNYRKLMIDRYLREEEIDDILYQMLGVKIDEK